MNRTLMGSIFCVMIAVPLFCKAADLNFENFASPGGLTNISPGSPYFEAGFRIAPTNGSSAVFDSANTSQMIGNSTDWFGFQEDNTPSLTLTASTGRFNIQDLLIGPTTIASSSVINMTITGSNFGGGSVSSTFTGLSTATTASLNWTDVISVVFTATDDAGLDNIKVSPIPEPSTFILTALGLSSMGVYGRRRRRE